MGKFARPRTLFRPFAVAPETPATGSYSGGRRLGGSLSKAQVAWALPPRSKDGKRRSIRRKKESGYTMFNGILAEGGPEWPLEQRWEMKAPSALEG